MRQWSSCASLPTDVVFRLLIQCTLYHGSPQSTFPDISHLNYAVISGSRSCNTMQIQRLCQFLSLLANLNVPAALHQIPGKAVTKHAAATHAHDQHAGWRVPITAATVGINMYQMARQEPAELQHRLVKVSEAAYMLMVLS